MKLTALSSLTFTWLYRTLQPGTQSNVYLLWSFLKGLTGRVGIHLASR
jgi:hypothetical protein